MEMCNLANYYFFYFVNAVTSPAKKEKRAKEITMCKIVHIAEQIVNKCVENKIAIDYFKTQKLAFLCYAYHLKKNDVPIAPERALRWTCGAAYKEIYTYFNKNDLLKVTNIQSKIPNTKNLLFFEQESVDYIVDKYAPLDFKQILKVVNTEKLFNDVSEDQEIPETNIKNFAEDAQL